MEHVFALENQCPVIFIDTHAADERRALSSEQHEKMELDQDIDI